MKKKNQMFALKTIKGTGETETIKGRRKDLKRIQGKQKAIASILYWI